MASEITLSVLARRDAAHAHRGAGPEHPPSVTGEADALAAGSVSSTSSRSVQILHSTIASSSSRLHGDDAARRTSTKKYDSLCGGIAAGGRNINVEIAP